MLTNSSKSHWFHRNSSKFTTYQKFETDELCQGQLASKVLNELKLARFDLLNTIYLLESSDKQDVKQKFEKYIGLLLGLCGQQLDGSVSSSRLETSENKSSGLFSSKTKTNAVLKIPLKYAFMFRWTDSLCSNLKSPISTDRNDANLDLINVTIQYAFYLMKSASRAASKESPTMDDAKEILNSIKLSASVLTFVKNHLVQLLDTPIDIEENPISDMDTRVLDSYILQMKAEAVEVICARAIKQEHKHHLIASLANQIAILFDKAYDTLNSIKNTEKHSKWLNYLKTKLYIYQAIAYGYYGNAISDKKETSGKSVGYLKRSVQILEEATKFGKKYTKSYGAGTEGKPYNHPFFATIKLKIEKMLKLADDSRMTIFGVGVPDNLDEPEWQNDVSKFCEIDESWSLPTMSKIWTKECYDEFYIKRTIESGLMSNLTISKKPNTEIDDVVKEYINKRPKSDNEIKVYEEKNLVIKEHAECVLM